MSGWFGAHVKLGIGRPFASSLARCGWGGTQLEFGSGLPADIGIGAPRSQRHRLLYLYRIGDG